MLGSCRAMREAASRVHGTKRPVVAWLVIGLGGVVLVVALATSLRTWHFTRTAHRTSGTVIEMRGQADKESGSVNYAPTFRFQDGSGAEHTVSSSFYSSPAEFRVGDRVGVLYPSNAPKSARIDSYWQVWGLPSLLGIIGGIELPVGLILLFWPKITGRFRRHTTCTSCLNPLQRTLAGRVAEQYWAVKPMNRLLFLFAALLFASPSTRASSQPEIYSRDFWEIDGKPGNTTWVEIHNSKEAQATGIAHVSIITRKKGSPVWELQWICPHIAVATDALKRSVVRPFKTRAAYPERFFEAYDRWKDDKTKGTAVICSTSIQDYLKEHP